MEETRLSRETVVDSAIELIDAEGLDALTIRRLAQVRGVTPMALYWHFKNKDELLLGVAGRIWSLMDTSLDPALDPAAQFRALITSLLSVLRAHPAAVPLLTRPGAMMDTHCFDAMESALTVLAQLGFGSAEGAAIVQQSLRLVVSLVTGGPDAESTGITEQEHAEMLRHKLIRMQTLPRDRYPHVVECAPDLVGCGDGDTYYDMGLEVFIGGLQALLAQRTAGRS